MKNSLNILTITYFLLVILLLNGCGRKQIAPDAIRIVDPYGEANSGYEFETYAYNNLLNQWQSNHAWVNIDRKAIQGNDSYYDQEIMFYGTIDRSMPDIFVLNENRIEEWIDKGLIGDKEIRYIYPMPVKRFSIIVYDKDRLELAGYEDFPDNWTDVLKAFDNRIAFDYQKDSIVSEIFLSPNLEIFCGEEWMNDIESGAKKLLFTQQCFENALNSTKRMCDCCLSCSENKKGCSALDSFLNRDYSAAVIFSNDIGTLKKVLQDSNPERYRHLGFSFLPQKISKDDEGSLMTTMARYVLVINPKVAENAEKLTLCMDLCEYLTNEESVEQIKGMEPFKNDVTWKELNEMLESRTEILGFVEGNNAEVKFGREMSYSCNPDLTEWAINGAYSLEEIENRFQDCYERGW